MMTEVVLAEQTRTDRLLEVQDDQGVRSYQAVRRLRPSEAWTIYFETSDLGAAIGTAALRMDCTEEVVEQAVRDKLDAIAAVNGR